jgi:hypothetical protein
MAIEYADSVFEEGELHVDLNKIAEKKHRGNVRAGPLRPVDVPDGAEPGWGLGDVPVLPEFSQVETEDIKTLYLKKQADLPALEKTWNLLTEALVVDGILVSHAHPLPLLFHYINAGLVRRHKGLEGSFALIKNKNQLHLKIDIIKVCCAYNDHAPRECQV